MQVVCFVSYLHDGMFDYGGGPWRLLQFCLSIACDAMLTTGLAYYLKKGDHGTNLFGTRNLVRRLTTYFILIGLVTSVLALVSLCLWLRSSEFLENWLGWHRKKMFVSPSGYKWASFGDAAVRYMVFYLLINPAYVNTYMASLNSRVELRQAARPPTDGIISIHIPTLPEIMLEDVSEDVSET
ncbi:hypothetical protein HGRIS_000684 [Hohenbuehelia grisea]|uniref:DUF6534 domain-containing protein n=1 Tax=Hohenbuehelia grisea TaxID=104357 RepID=A0ABR3JTP3_9AGAR